MADGGRGDSFVLEMIEAQNRLYAYVLSLVLDRERAKDVVQQTNLVLLEKQSDYQPGTDFFAWVSRVAFYEVLADRRRHYRDRHLFSDELLAVVASESLRETEGIEERTAALRQCLERLSPEHRDIVIARYRPGGSVSSLAQSLGKTPNAVSAILHRLRTALLDCVSRRLGRKSPI
jgi:RNA polymerase sigma-70 factor (ECF subfamily)